MPATAGSARTAAAALPPLRLRSRPQPHRTSAGDVLDVEIGELPQVRGVDARLSRGALDRPGLGCRAQAIGTGRVRVEERLVGVTFLEEHPVQRERDGKVGAGVYRQVQDRLLREARSPRIDHHELCAAARASLRNGTRWMPEAPGLTPQRMISRACGIVRVGDAGHLAVEREIRGAGGRRAHRPREPRRAEPPEQFRVVGVLCEQAVRSAVTEGQDRFGAELIADLRHPPRDQVQRFGPAHACERALPLGAVTYRWIEHPILSVDALAEAAHLGADEMTREGFASPPSIFKTRPFSTVTSSVQESGQSRGQAVRTVE